MMEGSLRKGKKHRERERHRIAEKLKHERIERQIKRIRESFRRYPEPGSYWNPDTGLKVL